jgi:hypothetical protein
VTGRTAIVPSARIGLDPGLGPAASLPCLQTVAISVQRGGRRPPRNKLGRSRQSESSTAKANMAPDLCKQRARRDSNPRPSDEMRRGKAGVQTPLSRVVWCCPVRCAARRGRRVSIWRCSVLSLPFAECLHIMPITGAGRGRSSHGSDPCDGHTALVVGGQHVKHRPQARRLHPKLPGKLLVGLVVQRMGPG